MCKCTHNIHRPLTCSLALSCLLFLSLSLSLCSQWLSSPSCQRGSYAFYKSVSCRARPNGPLQVWRLGEFYYIRRGPQEPVCIAEVTLLWEEQGQHPLLASSRLYFLPEDTPKGRTRQHGEDEVLAVFKRIVVPVEDLVRWACPEPMGWQDRQQPSSCPAPDTPQEGQSSSSGTTAEQTSQPLGDKSNAAPVGHQGVKVLSYPQYCRFRSLQRRLQDRAGLLGGADPHLLALGGLRVALSNTRVMYCRETFNHPTLDTSSSLWPHFRCPSLSLRGRPRKKKPRDAKEPPTLTRSQSEAWMDKIKDNVMGNVDTSPERAWFPHPEEQLFLDQLFVFMERYGRPINKVPNLGFKKIDLFRMYSVVQGMGGYEKVTSERLWKVVYNDLGGCPGSTSAATCTRRHYERLMLGYEEHVRAGGAGLKLPESPAPPKFKAIREKKPLTRGRKPGTKAKESKGQPAKPPAATPDGTAVVKRGRGRPPGRRNKATLLAQAKFLAHQQAKAKVAVPSSPPTIPAPAPPPPHRVTTRYPQALIVQSPSAQPSPLAHMPLTPDLSPLTAPLLPFLTKPGLGVNQEAGAPPGMTVKPLSAGSLLSSPPGPPMLGICPLDTFRTRLGLQHAVEDPALHKPVAKSPQSTVVSCPQPPPHHHNHQPCSGCVADEGAQKGGSKEGKGRPPLPPLRVFPLDLDCSVQVRQLMRTPLGAVQLQSFTRRLSEVLAQDLRAKPLPHPCSPITPPPEQVQPLNLSQRPLAKRPAALSMEQPVAKQPRPGESLEQADAEDLCPDGRSVSGGGGTAELETQEEPADLSSPSRIRAFLMGLPPLQVCLEEDLNEAGSATSLPVPPLGDKGPAEDEPVPRASGDEGPRRLTSVEEGPGAAESMVTDAPLLEAVEAREGEEREGENSVSLSGDPGRGSGGQEVAEDKEEVRCDDFPAQGLSRTLLPPGLTQHS
ncbi:AT-rich interactive domain-containing protein 5B [Merluccius polli]|uniref:AT-rich interactive domain-containing protein 5B n=1 Tax=Merluccius polli TaxID=89951 RepID=A0AA47MQ81_MERPO|nr:AT-rich interactive domain-containing protein 5B [Merluccius polli]